MLRVRLLRSRFIFLPNSISISRQVSQEKAPKILQFYFLYKVWNVIYAFLNMKPSRLPPYFLRKAQECQVSFPTPNFFWGEKKPKKLHHQSLLLFSRFLCEGAGGGRLLSGGVKGGLLPIQREKRVCIDIKKILNRCRKHKTISLPFNKLLPETVTKTAKVSKSII